MMLPDNPSSTSLDPQAIAKKLEIYYDQLTELSATHTEDKAVELRRVSEEASQLVDQLTAKMKSDNQNRLSRNQLLDLQQKVTTLVQTIKQQMSGTKEQLLKIKKGQTAIKGYRPIHVGMGFTEGKFVDSKK